MPNRLVDNRWQAIMGENTQSAWAPASTPQAPVVKIQAPVTVGSIADYMGIPAGMSFSSSSTTNINIYPFRAFALIWNDWFRDENVAPPMSIQKGNSATSEALNANSWSVNNYTGMPPKTFDTLLIGVILTDTHNANHKSVFDKTFFCTSGAH